MVEVFMPERWGLFRTCLPLRLPVEWTDDSGLQGREGVVIVKTTMAILIAHYKDGMLAGNTATTVEQLADYLIKTGY